MASSRFRPSSQVLARKWSGEPVSGIATPSVRLGVPGERARRDQATRLLGDSVVVGRGAAAGEPVEVPLVPPDLAERVGVGLEQVADLGPAVQETSHPRPGDEADAELDATGPVHPGEERVRGPPGAQLAVDDLGVPLVVGQPVRRGEHGEVVVAGELPHCLDVARHGLVAVVDAEREGVVRGPPSRSPGRRTSPVTTMSVRATPSTLQSPASSLSAASMTSAARLGRNAIPWPRAVVATGPRRAVRRPATVPPSSPARTCRDAHARRCA